jgi:hypothetical protein
MPSQYVRSSATLFLWTVAAVYVLAYVFRWLYLSYYMTVSVSLTEVSPDWNMILPRALDGAFLISSVIFGLFFLSTVVARGRPTVRFPMHVRSPGTALLSGFLLFVVFTVVFRVLFGAALGEAASEIPFGLGTPVYRAQADLIPGIFLLFAEAAYREGHRRKYLGWVVALAAFNLALGLITTSKAGLIFFIVQLLFLMYLTGQNIFARPITLAILGVGSLLAFIVAAQLRAQTLLGTDALIMISLYEGRVLQTLLEVSGLILNRLPGVEGLALYCGYACNAIPALETPSFSGEAGAYFTQQVIGVQGDFDYRSPGLIGGAIIIAGSIGGGMLVVAFLRSVLSLLKFMDNKGFSAAARALLCFGIFRFILEGIWAWQDLASLAIGVILVELTARRLRESGSLQRDERSGWPPVTTPPLGSAYNSARS